MSKPKFSKLKIYNIIISNPPTEIWLRNLGTTGVQNPIRIDFKNGITIYSF